MEATATPGLTSTGLIFAASFGSIVIRSNLIFTGSLMLSYRPNV
jgi:hypothetical protein